MPKSKPDSEPVKAAKRLLGAHNVRPVNPRTGAPIPPSRKELAASRVANDLSFAPVKRQSTTALKGQRSDKVTDRLNDMLDQPEAEAVILEVGERLLGTVVDNEVRHGAYDDEKGHMVTLIQNDDNGGIVAFHWLGAVLRSRFEQKNPRPGDRVGILRLADIPVKVKGQSDMKNYKVAVERAGLREEDIPF